MLSYYFYKKTKTNEFKENLNGLIKELYGKKVLLYGVGSAFTELNKKFELLKNFNIRLVSDKKFEKKKDENFMGIKTVAPYEIRYENFDIILNCVENSAAVESFLVNDLHIDKNKIRSLFKFAYPDELNDMLYLHKYNFEKTLPKLVNTLKNKKVVIYGADDFFKLIYKNFDLSKLNIIGVTGENCENHLNNEVFLEYDVYSLDEVKELNPDYIIVAQKYYVNTIEDLYNNHFKQSKVKILPIQKKPLLSLIKEAWLGN
ncbi:hypothetical protein IJI31_04190 [bacterium]|nr:hypothetical protein [bacterium]